MLPPPGPGSQESGPGPPFSRSFRRRRTAGPRSAHRTGGRPGRPRGARRCPGGRTGCWPSCCRAGRRCPCRRRAPDADEGVGPLPRRLLGAEVRADPPRGEVVPGEIEPTPTVDRVVATQAEELVLLPVADERVGEPAARRALHAFKRGADPRGHAVPAPRRPRCRRPSRPRARRSRTRPRRSRCRSRRRARSGRPHPRRSRRRRPACPRAPRPRPCRRSCSWSEGGVVPSAATAAGRSRRR